MIPNNSLSHFSYSTFLFVARGLCSPLTRFFCFPLSNTEREILWLSKSRQILYTVPSASNSSSPSKRDGPYQFLKRRCPNSPGSLFAGSPKIVAIRPATSDDFPASFLAIKVLTPQVSRQVTVSRNGPNPDILNLLNKTVATCLTSPQKLPGLFARQS